MTNRSNQSTNRRDNQTAPLPGEATLENARRKAEHFAAIERLALEKHARALVKPAGAPKK